MERVARSIGHNLSENQAFIFQERHAPYVDVGQSDVNGKGDFQIVGRTRQCDIGENSLDAGRFVVRIADLDGQL